MSYVALVYFGNSSKYLVRVKIIDFFFLIENTFEY